MEQVNMDLVSCFEGNQQWKEIENAEMNSLFEGNEPRECLKCIELSCKQIHVRSWIDWPDSQQPVAMGWHSPLKYSRSCPRGLHLTKSPCPRPQHTNHWLWVTFLTCLSEYYSPWPGLTMVSAPDSAQTVWSWSRCSPLSAHLTLLMIHCHQSSSCLPSNIIMR